MPTSQINMTVNLPSAGAIPTTATFDRFDPSSYNQSTSTTIYDNNGNPQTMTTYFKRTAASTGPGVNSTWDVYNYVGDMPLTAGGSTKITLTFDSTGALTAPTAADHVRPVHARRRAERADRDVQLRRGDQRSSAQPFNISSRTQDGKAVGQIEGVTVDERRHGQGQLLERRHPGARQGRARQLHRPGGPAPARRLRPGRRPACRASRSSARPGSTASAI